MAIPQPTFSTMSWKDWRLEKHGLSVFGWPILFSLCTKTTDFSVFGCCSRDYRDPQRPWCTGMRMHSRATRTANDTALAVAPETVPRAEPGANRVLPASNPKTARMPSTQSSMGASDLGAADRGLKDASSVFRDKFCCGDLGLLLQFQFQLVLALFF